MAGPQLHAPRIVLGNPPELVVYDREQACPYLRERTSRLPLRLPSRPLSHQELDERLTRGDRRQGFVLYKPQCPSCHACEAIRIDVRKYELSASQKRTLRRGDRELVVRMGQPSVDHRRVEIYNAHKAGRGLRDGQPPIDADGYRDFLVASCCDTFELAYHSGSSLAGIAIVDRAEDALSAVYCCYDPAFSRYGIGTYSILKQLELCRKWGLSYLYLGLYIAECTTMQYKATFLPHERLLDGRWQSFEAAAPLGRTPAPPSEPRRHRPIE